MNSYRVGVTTAMLGSGDVEAALANSAISVEPFGHVVVAWMRLQQLLAAKSRPVTCTTATAKPRVSFGFDTHRSRVICPGNG